MEKRVKNGTFVSPFSTLKNKTVRATRVTARASYGTWKCERCNLVFETRAKLHEHNRQFHPVPKGKAWNSGKTMKNEPRLRKASNTLKASYRSGKCINPLKGKKHTEEEKDKIRIGYSKYIERKSNKTRVNYNVDSISIIESIGKEHGWNFQHAENGGEVIILGYWLDAYDKEHNVVLEFDEPRHYIDIENNILIAADLKRQQKIIDYLHCEFWRYNETTGKLWRADKSN